jgi:hypothetical protein
MKFFGMSFNEINRIEDDDLRKEGIDWYLQDLEDSLQVLSDRFVEVNAGERIRVMIEKSVFYSFADWCGKANDIQKSNSYINRWFTFGELIIEEGD